MTTTLPNKTIFHADKKEKTQKDPNEKKTIFRSKDHPVEASGLLEQSASSNSKIKKKTKRKGLRLLRKMILYGILLYVLLTYVFGWMILHDNYMFPSIKDGDLCIIYKLNEPLVDNIVVYEANGIERIGRVVGVPGDEIFMNEESYFTVNGNVPYENIFYRTEPAENGVPFPYVVNEGEYFVLNDMRDDTNDSRVYGAISLEQIKGVLAFQCRQRSF